MDDICGDNRFELIEKYKQKLLDATNIEDSPEEMAVIDNILFRFWQMGWLDKDTNVANNDCISRAAVLNLIEQSCCDLEYDSDNVALRKEVEALPSAQPESCEYYALCRHGRDENKLRARLGFCEYCNEDADGFVTPIDKNGHAFVRFGMNGWELNLKANGCHGSAKIRYCPMCGRDLFVK